MPGTGITPLDVRPIPIQNRPYDILQLPLLRRLKACLIGIGHRFQRILLVEAVDANPLQTCVWSRPADIHEASPILDPQAAIEPLLGNHPAECLGADFLGKTLRERHQPLTDKKGQDRQEPGHPEQRHQQIPGSQTGSTQHRDFGMSRQRRQRVQGADQRGNRDQFVNQPGHAQRHEKQRMAQLVTRLADIAQFVDQVKKAE